MAPASTHSHQPSTGVSAWWGVGPMSPGRPNLTPCPLPQPKNANPGFWRSWGIHLFHSSAWGDAPNPAHSWTPTHHLTPASGTGVSGHPGQSVCPAPPCGNVLSRHPALGEAKVPMDKRENLQPPFIKLSKISVLSSFTERLRLGATCSEHPNCLAHFTWGRLHVTS